MNEDVKKAAGAKKTNLALMPPTAEDQCCKVLALGAAKYGEWNWRMSGVEAATYVAAIRRHLNAIVRGEWYDHESQCSHFAHIMASAAIVLDADSIGLCKREAAPASMVSDCHRGVGEGDAGMDDPPEVKAGLPKLPYGWVYYGLGPVQNTDNGFSTDIMGFSTYHRVNSWIGGGWRGREHDTHYAIRKGSEIAKLNGL